MAQKLPKSLPTMSDEKTRIVTSVMHEMDKLRYKVYPSTLELAVKYSTQAERKGRIRTNREFGAATAALLVAGAEQARVENRRAIQPRHIDRGWDVRLRRGPGNCPPHKCLRDSVIRVEAQLQHTLPEMKVVMEAVDQLKGQG